MAEVCVNCYNRGMNCINQFFSKSGQQGTCVPRTTTTRVSSCASLTDKICAQANRGKACKVARNGGQCYCSCRSVTGQTLPSRPTLLRQLPSKPVVFNRPTLHRNTVSGSTPTQPTTVTASSPLPFNPLGTTDLFPQIPGEIPIPVIFLGVGALLLLLILR